MVDEVQTGGRPAIDIDEMNSHRVYVRLDLADCVGLRRAALAVGVKPATYVRLLIQRHLDELAGVAPSDRRGKGLLFGGDPRAAGAKATAEPTIRINIPPPLPNGQGGTMTDTSSRLDVLR